jgi:hypothetical protein
MAAEDELARLRTEAYRRLGRDLRALHAQADGEFTRLQGGEST